MLLVVMPVVEMGIFAITYIGFFFLGFFGSPINGIPSAFVVELLYPIPEGTALGVLSAEYYFTAIFVGVFSSIL